MPSYAAFLGHQPRISLAELSASVPGFEAKKVVDDSIAFFDSPAELDASFLDTLGGTVILSKRVTENSVTLEDIPSILLNELKEAKRGKITFSLRTRNIPHASVRTLYRRCKEAVRKLGRPCRYVGNDRTPAPSVVLREEELLDGKRGCEIVLIAQEEEDLWVGRTVAAQDVDAYTKRDMRKPVRDTMMGLLPPKLAQILLNFGGWLARGCETPLPDGKKKKEDPFAVFDPFCGTGVIPLECLMRGWHVLASDVSQKAVNGCEKNLEWLRKEEKILKKDVESSVFKHDALKPFELKKLPNALVTETTLGPALLKRPAVKDVLKLRTENERLQAEFVENCSKTLPGVPIVLTWPFWKVKNSAILLERAWDAAHAAGYHATLPPGIDPTREGRLSLLYRRPDQFVGREIVLLIPRKRK